MKKSLLIIFSVFLFLPAIVFGQDQITVKFGLAQANMSVELDTDEFESKSGVAFGTSFIHRMNNSLSFEYELMYTENGYFNPVNESYFHFNYNKLSFLLRFHIDKMFNLPNGRISLFAIAGPHFGVLISSQKEDNLGEVYSLRDRTVYDAGLIFGGGLGYNFDFGTLSIETRYDLGLINTYVNESDIAVERIRKNKAWLFLLSYSINLND